MSNLSASESRTSTAVRVASTIEYSRVEMGEHFNGFYHGSPQSAERMSCYMGDWDRLTKSAHFLPVKESTTTDQLAQIYLKEIVRLHGVPKTIVSDRDSRFVSAFWTSL